MAKHAAKVYPLAGRGTVTVKQLILRNGEYVGDGDRERHVPLSDDKKLADAIRGAMEGRLEKDESLS